MSDNVTKRCSRNINKYSFEKREKRRRKNGETDRQRQRQRDRETERERDRQRQRQSHREKCSDASSNYNLIPIRVVLHVRMLS